MVAELLVSVIPLLHLHLLSCARPFEFVRLSFTHVVITCAPDLSAAPPSVATGEVPMQLAAV